MQTTWDNSQHILTQPTLLTSKDKKQNKTKHKHRYGEKIRKKYCILFISYKLKRTLKKFDKMLTVDTKLATLHQKKTHPPKTIKKGIYKVNFVCVTPKTGASMNSAKQWWKTNGHTRASLGIKKTYSANVDWKCPSVPLWLIAYEQQKQTPTRPQNKRGASWLLPNPWPQWGLHDICENHSMEPCISPNGPKWTWYSWIV